MSRPLRSCARAIAAVSGLAAATAASQDVAPPNDRLHVRSAREIIITASVPDAAETESIFGADLYDRGIQPVWIRVENVSANPLRFLPAAVDADYLTPTEVLFASGQPHTDVATIAELERLGMIEHIEGGSAQSGYVFTGIDEGTKSFNVRLHGPESQHNITFFVPVPGLRLDHYEVDFEALYGAGTVVDVDLEGLAAGLEALPCCISNEKGTKSGDPLNLAFVGEFEEIYHALLRAGWDETETVYGGSLLRMLRSMLSGTEYRYSPVSPLYVFGRPQDAAFQKARSNISERNHLRIWLTDMRFRGKPVWVGQISRDIGVRLERTTGVTHKIDPDVDETREYLFEDLVYSQSIEAYGYVRGSEPARLDAPRQNLTGDPYFSDGRRIVLFLSPGHVSINDVSRIVLGTRP